MRFFLSLFLFGSIFFLSASHVCCEKAFKPKECCLYLYGAFDLATFQNTENTITLNATVPIVFTSVDELEIQSRSPLNMSGRGGIGWKWNRYIRTDFCYTYLQFDLRAFQRQLSNTLGLLRTSNTFFQTKTNLFLFNGSIDLAACFGYNDRFLHPYFGGGLGFALNKTEDVINTPIGGTSIIRKAESRNNNSFAAQAFIGLDYYLTERFILNSQYSYIYAGRSKFGPNITGVSDVFIGSLTEPASFSVQSNLFSVGVMYLF